MSCPETIGNANEVCTFAPIWERAEELLVARHLNMRENQNQWESRREEETCKVVVLGEAISQDSFYYFLCKVIKIILNGFYPVPPSSFPFRGPTSPVGLNQGRGATICPSGHGKGMVHSTSSIPQSLAVWRCQKWIEPPAVAESRFDRSLEFFCLPSHCPLLRLSSLLGAS